MSFTSVSPCSLMPFGLTIRPFVSLQTVMNGRRRSGASTRCLMAGLPIKLLFAGIDLIELRR
jgi:hypothetical protein